MTRMVALLVLISGCGGAVPDAGCCLPDWSWCIIATPDGGRIVGGP